MRERTYLFVYGTLMNGMEAEELLVDKSARLIGRGKISGELVDLGEFPGAIQSTNPSDVVFGEVYELPGEAVLRRLDAYEEYDTANPAGSLFLRDRVQVELVDKPGVGVEAWTYFYNQRRGRPKGRPIRSGDYRSYRQPVSS